MRQQAGLAHAGHSAHSNPRDRQASLGCPATLRPLMNRHDARLLRCPPAAQTYVTSSSVKPEIHDLLHCRQKRTEPRSQATSTENFVKFGRVVFEICQRTDRQANTQTDTLIAIPRTPPKGEAKAERSVSWSLTSLFSTNMAISETNGHSL